MFNWFAFLTYAVITAATPGPNNIMSMSNGGRLGFKGALPFNFGILAGFAAVMLICTAFCSTLTELIPAVKTPMLIAGAAYMLHLAWATYIKATALLPKTTIAAAFIPGLFCSLSTLKFTFTALCPCRPIFCRFTRASLLNLPCLRCCLPLSVLYLRCAGRRLVRQSAFCSAAIPKASTPSWRCFWFTAPHHCSDIKKIPPP